MDIGKERQFMNPDNRFQLLQLSLAKMTVLLREACAGKMHDEQISAELRDEADKLRADLAVVREEFNQYRDRDNRLLCQHKEILRRAEAELVSSSERCQRAEFQATIEIEHAKTWKERYELVDCERKDRDAEVFRLRQEIQKLTCPTKGAYQDHQEILALGDVQICPACSEQQLVHVAQQLYECLYCEQSFNLAW
jgi:hypothetical protein